MAIGTRVRQALFRTGRHLGDPALARLRSALGYLEIGALSRSLAPTAEVPLAADRFAVFEAALPLVRGEAPLYLEFGVYEGETMRWWAQNLTPPRARLVGFDSFAGLPEDWRPGFDRGQFDTGGPPRIDDERVAFVAGWFSETLRTFDPPPHDQLIVNVDSDLYSSAVTVLEWLPSPLPAGTLLYFDELADRDHELRALQEFLAASDVSLRPVVVGAGGRHFLFEVTG